MKLVSEIRAAAMLICPYQINIFLIYENYNTCLFGATFSTGVKYYYIAPI